MTGCIGWIGETLVCAGRTEAEALAAAEREAEVAAISLDGLIVQPATDGAVRAVEVDGAHARIRWDWTDRVWTEEGQ